MPTRDLLNLCNDLVVTTTARQLPPGQPPRNRLGWIDAAKGLCMALVVLWHVSLWYQNEINTTGQLSIWYSLGEFFAPVRMPLFFFISGLLVTSALQRTLGQTRTKTLGIYYLYVLWTTLFLCRLFLPFQSDHPPTVRDLVISALLPASFWYLWALPAFFLFTWAVRRVFGARGIYFAIPLAILSALSPWIEDATRPLLEEPLDALKLGSVASNLVWYFCGAYLRDVCLSRMGSASTAKARAGVLMYTVCTVGALLLGVEEEVKVLIAPIALWAALQVFGTANVASSLGRSLQWIGRQTLPVYIFHIFAISVLSAAVKISGLDEVLRANALLWATLLPPVLAAGIIVSARLLGQGILASPARWLLQAPPLLVKSTTHGRHGRG
ncbi:acyltransferase family protein [Rhodococcus sp. IEGM 1366]|uniref:acyltransferase family protein n=1 Tax=Rhodococcus sp. IEGM 1366 TaxID=3082223 RepID=UPI0029552ADC|nr:acyltransferase family protein [Rhodococcus sp. IEGM 1366]MDV8069605.1 acyltransferase family protein [Rhodococcus sp. IEGM 1366]